MSGEETNRRRHESIPGEARLASLLPTGWTLMLVIGTGVAYATWGWIQIEANASALEKVIPQIENTERATAQIRTDQQLMKQKLDNFMEIEAERRAIAAERDANIQRLLQELLLRKGPDER